MSANIFGLELNQGQAETDVDLSKSPGLAFDAERVEQTGAVPLQYPKLLLP